MFTPPGLELEAAAVYLSDITSNTGDDHLNIKHLLCW